MDKVIIEKLTSDQIHEKGINAWPVWKKDISRFEWFYDDEEQCYILEGNVIVKTDENIYEISGGDFVTFKKGLKCIWDIKEKIKKHYTFIDS